MRFWHLLVLSAILYSNGHCIELTGLFGRISSPGFPKPYPNDQTTTWDIKVPEGHRIKIYFIHFNLELSYLCEYDYVELKSKDTVVSRFCGTESTDTEKAPGDSYYYSLDNKMTVTFVSDFSNEKEFTGFEAFYAAEDIDECAKHDEDTEVCDHFCHNHIGGHYCSCRAGFQLHTDKKTCLVKCDNVVYTKSSGEIVSPDFPGIYPKLTNCRYQIQAEEGFSILLRFLHFDVESHPDVVCPYDRLQITAGGKDLPPLCGATLPSEIDTRSRKVDIVFTTDGSGHHTGWELQYTTTALPCPDPVKPDKGLFTPAKTRYVVKDSLTLSCEKGYTVETQNGEILSSFTAVCRSDGTWDKPLPKCSIVDCGPPEGLENGKFKFETKINMTTYNAQILYQCEPYYKVNKDLAQYRCGERGDWVEVTTGSRTIPTCVPECGEKDLRIVGRILGGDKAELGEFPWQVLIETENNVYGGGALLSDKWIITAAHVLVDSIVSIKMGFVNRKATNYYTAVPDLIFVHPNFIKKTYNNDIALIKLQDKVPMSKDILPICLPTKDERFKISDTSAGHNIGVVSGWGKTDPKSNTGSDDLLYVPLEIVDRNTCNEVFQILQKKTKKNIITNNMFCAGREGKDSCAGDSGGAMVFKDTVTEKWFIGGIVSWGGEECGAANQYGVYTKVRNYLDWIQEKMSNKE